MKSKLRLHVPFHVVLFVLLVTSFRWALAGAIAFERGDFIWVANADGTGSRKLTKGVAPSFSPDGKQLAFQTDSSTASEVVRQIAIADVASGRVTVFHDGVPSRNCQQAVWSPDGAHIVFSIFDGSDWNLAMIKS
ncbi:MAG: hypothetical protein M3R10_08415, partial [Verrucomicrobiota bacterium]|nr:hypothetical protein [Verrucomicrobiota bacterium]